MFDYDQMAHEEGRLSLIDPATYSESLKWHVSTRMSVQQFVFSCNEAMDLQKRSHVMYFSYIVWFKEQEGRKKSNHTNFLYCVPAFAIVGKRASCHGNVQLSYCALYAGHGSRWCRHHLSWAYCEEVQHVGVCKFENSCSPHGY